MSRNYIFFKLYFISFFRNKNRLKHLKKSCSLAFARYINNKYSFVVFIEINFCMIFQFIFLKLIEIKNNFIL